MVGGFSVLKTLLFRTFRTDFGKKLPIRMGKFPNTKASNSVEVRNKALQPLLRSVEDSPN
jgi:hypothetical protein